MEAQVETLLRLIYDNKLNEDSIVPHINVINYSKGDGYFTPLMNAIYHGKREAALTLLNNQADPAIRVVSICQYISSLYTHERKK